MSDPVASHPAPLRIGIVGLGIGRHHLRAYAQTPDLDPIALADVDEERLTALGAEYQVPYLYTDYEAMLAREDLDAVAVCTPNHLHAPMAIAALERGKHVLCEKPLARTVAEAEAVVAAAQRAGRVLHVVFNHRKRGDVETLKRAIDEGRLGRIYHAKAHWLRRNGIPGMGGWFTNKAMSGGGPLIDLGVHMLDMALYLLGEPRPLTVSAATYAELGPRGRGSSGARKPQVHSGFDVEDLASALIRFEGDRTLALETSWATYRSNDDEFGITLYGAEGGAEIKVCNYVGEGTLRIFVDYAGTPCEIHPHAPQGLGHAAVAQEFVDIVRGGNWAEHIGDEGLARMRILEACYRSAEAHREVAL